MCGRYRLSRRKRFKPKFPEPRKYAVTFDDMDGPEEDDLSGYEDFDDDHLANAATREEL